MKLEIEITEDEICSTIERKVRVAVAEYSNHYLAESYIKEQIRQHWKAAVDHLIVEALNDIPVLRDKIAAELERKLRYQLAAAIKTASKEENLQ